MPNPPSDMDDGECGGAKPLCRGDGGMVERDGKGTDATGDDTEALRKPRKERVP